MSTSMIILSITGVLFVIYFVWIIPYGKLSETREELSKLKDAYDRLHVKEFIYGKLVKKAEEWDKAEKALIEFRKRNDFLASLSECRTDAERFSAYEDKLRSLEVDRDVARRNFDELYALTKNAGHEFSSTPLAYITPR